MRRYSLFTILILLICAPSYAEDFTRILKIDAKRIGDYTEVTVHTSAKITPQIILLESPNRIAMSFPNSRIDASVTVASPSPIIRMIQAAQFDENTVYVIIEPKEELTYDYASIIGRNTVILEMTKARPGSQKRIAPSVASSEVVQVSGRYEVPTPEVEIIPSAKETLVSSIEMTVSSKEAARATIEIEVMPIATKEYITKPKLPQIAKQTLPLAGKVIMIDPGHGGRDPGYVGKSGILEKALTLKIAKKLQTYLNNVGAKVILSRYGDVSTTDRGIVALANNNNADLFIAIHLNSYTSSRIGGTETYYFTPISKGFAKVMQKNLSSVLKRRSRGIKKVTYYTVHHTKMPAVLVEAVYLTNPTEEKLILRPEYQGSVAYGIYKGIREYVKITSYVRNIPGKTGTIRKSRKKN